MALKLRESGTSEHLKTEEDIAALYLEACLEGGRDDETFIARALGDIVSAGSDTLLVTANDRFRSRVL